MSAPAPASIPAPLPNPRRVVAAVDEAGKSVVAFDDAAGVIRVGGEDNGEGWPKVWVTGETPVELKAGDEEDKAKEIEVEGIVKNGGSVFKVIDLAPGAAFPLHYTHSVDYLTIATGELTMILSDDHRTTLRAGDLLVQLGDAHGFENNGSEWVRMVGVTIEAKPVELAEGKEVDGMFLA